MIHTLTQFAILAQSAPIETQRWRYRVGRMVDFSEPWHWLVAGIAVLVFIGLSLRLNRRDTVELSLPVSWFLQLMRVATLLFLVVWFLQLDRRVERVAVRPSRVVLMLDTSQSMAIRDAKGGKSRAEEMIDAFANGPLLTELRKQSNVDVMRFDQDDRPVLVASFPRTSEGVVHIAQPATGTPGATTQPALPAAAISAQTLALIAAGILGIGVLMFLIALIAIVRQFFGATAGDDVFLMAVGERRPAKPRDWLLLYSGWVMLAGGVALAACQLMSDHVQLDQLLTGQTWFPTSATAETPAPNPAKPAANESKTQNIDWQEAIAPRGVETRLGAALRATVVAERGGTAAGVIVLTDGNSTAGSDVDLAAQAASEAGLPIFPIGLGTDKAPLNLRVVDIEAPRRVYPGDKFTITGHFQATGGEAVSADVELVSKPTLPGVDTSTLPEKAHDARRLELPGGGEIIAIKFEISPGKDFTGKHEFRLRIRPQAGESNLTDNERSANVEIVDRKNRVLLIAGGPARDFIFLRNQLYRDRDTEVSVLLQTAKGGAAQEGHHILTEFPKTENELFEFDAIVAFDPDWSRLDDLQIASLERWVSEQSGGLIVVAGPIHTPEWSGKRDTGRLKTIRELYPVIFFNSGVAYDLGRFGSEQARPIEFTREGLSAEFLWLGTEAEKSQNTWKTLGGVFGYYMVKDPKPGAIVYSRFADPEARADNEFPIYMASHFFGSGRVFYLGSGEMWRTRATDEAYFEEFYTKLLRWVSEGRILRDAKRGMLLVDKQRCTLGERVGIRATLVDEQFRPLTQPQVGAYLVRPDGLRLPIELKKLQDNDRQGIYTEQVSATIEGDYRVELPIPGAGLEDLLTAEFRARLPSTETERSQRNDAVLTNLARKSGGHYFVGTDAATGPQQPVWKLLNPQDDTAVVGGGSDKRFQFALMAWLLALVVTALSLEWLIRRLHRLA